MMNHNDWLKKAHKEMLSLAPRAQDAPGDAWRAVVLIGRLLGCPDAPPIPGSVVIRLPELIRAASQPDPQEVLDDLVDGLDAGDDPWGPLMDAVIEADDTLNFMELAGQKKDAENLADRVAGILSVYPGRLLDLGAFAEMRLGSVRQDSPVAKIWRAVELAPARALADALPPQVPVRQQAATRPASPRPQGPAKATLLSLERFMRKAAADSEPDASSIRIDTEDPNQKVWLYPKEGQMQLEMLGTHLPAGAGAIIALRTSDHAEEARLTVDIEVNGETAYINLGPWAGPENLLHKLLAASGLIPGELIVRITGADE